jgi:hypothetical protein
MKTSERRYGLQNESKPQSRNKNKAVQTYDLERATCDQRIGGPEAVDNEYGKECEWADWNMRQGSQDDEVTGSLSATEPKQTAVAGFGGRCACRGAAGDGFKSVSEYTSFSMPALCSFHSLHLCLLCTRSHCLFSKPRVRSALPLLLFRRSCYFVALSQPMVAAAG